MAFEKKDPQTEVIDDMISEMQEKMLQKAMSKKNGAVAVTVEAGEPKEESEVEGLDGSIKSALGGEGEEIEQPMTGAEPSAEEKTQIAALYNKFCKGM